MKVMVVVRRFLTRPGGAVLTSDNIIIGIPNLYCFNLRVHVTPGPSLVCSSLKNSFRQLQIAAPSTSIAVFIGQLRQAPWSSVRERYVPAGQTAKS